MINVLKEFTFSSPERLSIWLRSRIEFMFTIISFSSAYILRASNMQTMKTKDERIIFNTSNRMPEEKKADRMILRKFFRSRILLIAV